MATTTANWYFSLRCTTLYYAVLAVLYKNSSYALLRKTAYLSLKNFFSRLASTQTKQFKFPPLYKRALSKVRLTSFENSL